ncbi:DUF6787 family protein [Vibrio sp. WJH972]
MNSEPKLASKPENNGWAAKLKTKWGVESHLQFCIILIVFSITGSVTGWCVVQYFSWLEIESESHTLLKVIPYVLGFFTYQLLLLIFGSISGQFRFFWKFQKKTIGRIAQLALRFKRK